MDCKIDQKAHEGSGHGTSKPAQDYEFDKKVDDLIKEISNTELVRQDDKKVSSDKCKGCGDYLVDDNNNELVEVGDDIYHDTCFVCDHCGEKLVGKFYNREDNKYCESHKEVGLEVCGQCGLSIEGTSILVAGLSYHPACFTCAECEAPIIDKFYTLEDGSWRCENCWRLSKPRCWECSLPILDKMLTALDRSYHPACFVCCQCGHVLEGGEFLVTGDQDKSITCRDCYVKHSASWCSRCQEPIVSTRGKRVTLVTCEGRKYHYNCYTCQTCGENMNGKEVYLEGEDITCKACKISGQM